MKHQTIDDQDRVYILTRGFDASHDQFDPQFLTTLGMANSTADIANVLIDAAGEMDVAENRLW